MGDVTHIDRDAVRRILIIKPSSLGDVVHALPTLQALRSRFPSAHIAWVVEEENADLLQGHPALDEIVLLRRGRWRRELGVRGALAEIWSWARRIRARSDDLVIDLQGLLKSAWIVLLSRAPYKVGLGEGREGSTWCLTHVLPAERGPCHAVDRYLRVARFLGAEVTTPAFHIPVDPASEARARDLLREAGAAPGRPSVILHAAARWGTKLWEEERFARLGDLLHTRWGATVLLTGTGADRPLLDAIARRMEYPASVLAGGTTLRELAALLRRVDLMVSVDSGPLHIASALGTPVVALFGPTDPRRTGPYGFGGAVLRVDLPCSPCRKARCQIADERLCMRSLHEEAVLQAAEKILERTRVT